MLTTSRICRVLYNKQNSIYPAFGVGLTSEDHMEPRGAKSPKVYVSHSRLESTPPHRLSISLVGRSRSNETFAATVVVHPTLAA